MGVTLWVPQREPVGLAPDGDLASFEEPDSAKQSRQSEVACMDWPDLERAVKSCIKCPLHATRTQTVFGVGHRQAKWMFIGLKREEVYIANVLKCRPPGNRDPRPEEVAQCEPYLLRQIDLIKPRLIVALGRHAAHSLLKTEVPLGKLRGQRLSYHGTPLIVTYHPAYLLRNPADKRKVWDDLCLAKTVMGAMTDPEKAKS